MSCDPKDLPSVEHDGKTYYVIGKFRHPLAAELFELYLQEGILRNDGYLSTVAEIEGVKYRTLAVSGTDCHCHLNGVAHGMDETLMVLKDNPEWRPDIDAQWESEESE